MDEKDTGELRTPHDLKWSTDFYSCTEEQRPNIL
jgi:hypothetical protein